MVDLDLYRQAADKAVAALAEVHRLLDPSAERVEIPFEGTTMVGNLRRPGSLVAERHKVGPSLAVLLPGLDSTKEEFFEWENVFLERGMATFSLDGPGQGETGYTTVLKLLQIMTEKRLVTRDESARTHVYEPAYTQDQTERQMVTDLLDRVFDGSAAKLVLQALASNKASPEELDEIKKLIATKTGGPR